ncbi:MAG: hypothetical protein WC881_09850 [Elusimicrobiota bacterium]|jgi:tetratricopeptide (TPR) repeat protein
MTRILATALLVLALLGRPAQAAFEDQGAGARAPGMGNAFTALADDVYAIYYNPAGLAQLERSQFSTSYSKLFTGLSDGTDLNIMQLAYAHPFRGGSKGTLGVAWQRFSASSLYYEQTLHLSYGRLLLRRDSGSHLLGGINIKQLTHGFGVPAEAAAPCNQGNCSTNNGTDPVLSGKNSKSAYDADLGFIYRLPKKFQFGLAAHHVMSPDVGFGGPDKVPMSLRVGAAYKSLWLSLMGEIRQETAPTGGTDRDLILAGERVFPTLTSGQFALRGSLGFGTRDFQQITMGASYRVNKIQIDYAFLMPMGTVKGTMGTHRVAFGWHFGAPTPDEEITQELLDQAKQLRDGRGPSYGYEYAEELKPQSIEDPRLAGIRRLIEDHQYQKAHAALVAMVKDMVPTAPLVRLANRLELISHYYPDWSGPRTQWETIVIAAVDHFLNGRDRKAILTGSYALSLSLNDVKFDHLLSDMETAVGIKADRLPKDHPRSFIDELLFRVEAANNRNELQSVELLLQDILELDPQNVIAVERVGSMYFILGKFQSAIDTWNRAMVMEKRPQDIENLKHYIAMAQERMGIKAPETAPATMAPAVVPAAVPPAAPAMAQPLAPAQTLAPAAAPSAAQPAAPAVAQPLAPAQALAPAAAPSAAKPAAPAAAQPVRRARPAQTAAEVKGDPRDVDRLFQKGVEHYARGEYLQATAMFMRILQIDPQNAQARKALERLENKVPRRK